MMLYLIQTILSVDSKAGQGSRGQEIADILNGGPFLANLCSFGPHSLLEEEDDRGDSVVEVAEQLLQLVSIPGILSDVAVLFHSPLQVFKLKIQIHNELRVY